MKKFVAQIFVVLFFAVSILSQTESQKIGLVTELGEANLEMIMLQLDQLIAGLSENPSAEAHIKIYGGDENYFSRAYQRGSLFNAYLKNTRKIAPEKYSFQFCNVNKEALYTELYIISPGMEIPECEENLEIPAKTVLFSEGSINSTKFKLTPIEELSIEIDIPDEWVSDQWDISYSEVAMDRIKKLLKDSPLSRVYIVAYLRTNFKKDENGKIIAQNTKRLDRKLLAAKILETAKKELLAKGFNASQIEVLDGGYVNGNRKLEFWFVPPGGEIPQPKTDYFPKKKSKK